MEKKISVIIPAYNTEKYIRSCLESVLTQKFHDFEVIVVDDASTDQTNMILREYQKRHPDIVNILTQTKNHRQGAARNRALKVAKGKYILFLDSDDRIEPETLERVWNKAKKNDADIVFLGYKFMDMQGNVHKESHVTPCMLGEMTFSKIKALFTTSVVPWSKLIRKSLIIDNKIYFPEDTVYEDHATTYLYYLYAKNTCLLNDYMYIYNLRPESTTTSKNQAYHMQHMNMSLLLVERLKKRGFGEKLKDEIEYFLFEQMYILGIKNILLQNSIENTGNYINKLLLKMNENCPDIEKNKYYIRYTSEQYKQIYQRHKENKVKFVATIVSGYFNQYCTNYMLNLDFSKSKIVRFWSKRSERIVLWGAGEYSRYLVKFLKRIEIPISRIVDKDVQKIHTDYEGYTIKAVDSIEEDELVLVPYIGWISNIINIMNSNNKRNKILNFEALIKYDIDNPIEDYWEE